MEDLKYKFLSFINKQNTVKVPIMGLNSALLETEQKCEDLQSETGQSTESEHIPDQEILESIEKIYFRKDDDFDPSRYELEKLLKVLQSKEIEKRYKKLKQQYQVVSKKVLQLILQKQSAYEKEFDNILVIQNQLQNMLAICRMGRQDLKVAKEQFTKAILGILANYKKRQDIEKLLKNVHTIKNFQRMGDQLEELLSKKNYPGAISLLLKCQRDAQTYKHFKCIAALNGKLQDILEQTEKTLDDTLSKMCTHFDETVYTSIQEAYMLLGKAETAVDQTNLHFTAAIHNTAFSVIHSYTEEDTQKHYIQLCQSVPKDKSVLCLIELCTSLWNILISYCRVICWHNVHESSKKNHSEEKDFEKIITNQYAKHKLDLSSMMRMWSEVEAEISMYLSNADLVYIKFEQYVHILGIVNRLMELGELSGYKFERLQEFMQKQSQLYFSHYNLSRLDELRIFLENDGWELCPVKPNFVATQLQEFKSLKPILNKSKVCNGLDTSIISETETSIDIELLLQKYLEYGTSPFTVGLDDTVEEDISARYKDDLSDDSDDDIFDEINREYVDESEHTKVNKKKHKHKHNEPIVTNTTLTILRVCGKYLQMSRLLRSIAVAVTKSMIQFFEIYFYTVHLFFTADLQISSEILYSPRLKLSLNRMKDNFIVSETETDDNASSNCNNKVRQPHLSSSVILSQPDKLYGLTERIVAVESLIFLGQQYENLKTYLEHLLGSSPQRGFLHPFYTQTIVCTTDLRKPVYMAVVSQTFDIANILNLMNKVNWEVTDVMSQHSNYIDVLLKEINVLNEKLNNIANSIPLSEEVHASIWENVAHLITHTLVEGFSCAKKCSNGGRGLMQLDFTQLKLKFEQLSTLKPMPHNDYVESYIKAYYLPENSLEEWIKEHKEYSVKHLIGLICSVCQNNKKTRQRLIASVDNEQRPCR
ncbi:syndetin [Polistes fuscatus]|uniref:syndetin n=1 Tax=Polistes fuscatus TaxID=30207 RepID=UPI001CA945E0|nr:syndetin [Polistes fuscatus]